MISPGKVYRRDSDDATHSHQFHQIEGLVIGEGITLADLKGTLAVFAKKLFGEEREIRLRPSYFPFTEPSVEVDVSCFKLRRIRLQRPANKPAGSKFWDLALSIPMFWKCPASTLRNTPGSHLV